MGHAMKMLHHAERQQYTGMAIHRHLRLLGHQPLCQPAVQGLPRQPGQQGLTKHDYYYE
jgi:hypothetical protein